MALPNSKIEVLYETLGDVGQIFFASALVEPITTHTATFWLVFTGLLLSVFCWTIRLIIVNNQLSYE